MSVRFRRPRRGPRWAAFGPLFGGVAMVIVLQSDYKAPTAFRVLLIALLILSALTVLVILAPRKNQHNK